MQGAYYVFSFNNPEFREIRTSMWTLALHDEVTELDFIRTLLLNPRATSGFFFRPTDAFNGETLEEVVEEFVEFPFAPRAEATTEEERIRPIHSPVSYDLLKEWTRNLESIANCFGCKLTYFTTLEVDDEVRFSGRNTAAPTYCLTKCRGENEERLPPGLHRGNEVS